MAGLGNVGGRYNNTRTSFISMKAQNYCLEDAKTDIDEDVTIRIKHF
jgi:hypothetical protein